MPQRSFRWLFISLALLGVSVDLASKYIVFRWLYNGTPSGSKELIPGVFRFHVDFKTTGEVSECSLVKLNGPVPPRVNHGALFGLGSEHTRTANYFFMAISIVAGGAILWWGMMAATRRDPLLCGALGLILGGTLGNLYDRIFFGGVRDFLYFYLIEWPVFNIADCCLVCGAITLLGHAIFVHPEKEVPVPLATAIE
ncbi:MAG: signal peptidase II [Planctomycetes bacterium]|nr:signal peptidase II [Planctomycetota bacterium]